MTCPRCRYEAPPGARFCEQCAAALTRICASCGIVLSATAKFCHACAHPVGTSPTTPSRAPHSYTPKHLAHKILTSRTALEGERKQVTVLFADLKDSMELLAHRDPEEARSLLDPVLERMLEAVHRYEGTVNQVMGDGIMALFGAPLAHEDHAVRACYAALRMRDNVRKYADELRRAHGPEVRLRVGLNSGEVVVRAIGSDLHMDYTAVGQTTHLAARMEQLARPDSVYLTAETARLAEGLVTVASLGPARVKGAPEPVEILELLGTLPTRTRMQVTAARGLTPLVARHTELNVLSQVQRRAAAGHGQLLAIVSDVGVGKSRLVWEFTHSSHTKGWRILESTSVSYIKATSYSPVIDLLRMYFHLDAHDTAARIATQVTATLEHLQLTRLLPPILTLLDVPADNREWDALDPPQRRRRTIDALKALLLRESELQPVLVIFEDLQWIDAETQAVLDGLVEILPAARMLLLVNYRPEYQHAWSARTYYTQLRLDPLPPDASRELLAAILGPHESLDPLKDLLIATTEGNPFFLEEIVRTLLETQALIGSRGAHRLVRQLDAIQIPNTVSAMLAARVDRLPSDAKRLLQCAAVIGKDFPLGLLEAIADVSTDELHHSLVELRAAEFLYETRLFPTPEYTFKHALTHEVTYATILQERRRDLHARIVDTIERLYRDRLVESVERLAEHSMRGCLWDKALRYLRWAGAKTLARSATREAVTWLERALGALKHLPESPQTVEQAIDIRFDFRGPLTALGEFGRIGEYLSEAERLADSIGDKRRLGRVSAYLTQFLMLTDHDRAVTTAQRALAIADALGDHDVRVVANNCLGDIYYFRGDFRRAREFHDHNRRALDPALYGERHGLTGLPAVFCRVCIAWCLLETGDFEEARASALEALAIADAVGHPYSRIWASFGVGASYLQRGEIPDAIVPLEAGLALSQATDIRVLFPYLAAMLGIAYARSGRLAEALPLLERARAAASALKITLAQSMILGFVSEAQALAGQTGEAGETAALALRLAQARQERAFAAWALCRIGESRLGSGEPVGAEDHYREALALATELGMRPVIGHCHAGLARVYRRHGTQQESEKHLSTAFTMYREMGMTYWLEKAQGELRQPG